MKYDERETKISSMRGCKMGLQSAIISKDYFISSLKLYSLE